MSEEVTARSEQPAKRAPRQRRAGQIITRGADKYLIRIFLGRDSTGKRHYHNETFHGKKKAAQDHMRHLLTKQKTGEPLKLGKDTLGAFLDEWLKANPDLKESSLTHYERTLRLYVRPRLGGLMLTKVEANDVQALYENLATDGLARSTINFVHTLLKSAFKLALRRRKLTFNPMDGVESPGGKKLEQERKQRRRV